MVGLGEVDLDQDQGILGDDLDLDTEDLDQDLEAQDQEDVLGQDLTLSIQEGTHFVVYF